LNFTIGAFKGISEFDLRVKTKGPKKIGVQLHLPPHVDNRAMSLENLIKIEDGSKYFLNYRVYEGETAVLNRLTFTRPIPDVAKILVKIPDYAEESEVYEIGVEQLSNNKVVGDFYVRAKIIDPKKAKYIAVRNSYFVHKADCEFLQETDRSLWIPFETTKEAQQSGYDLALDCLNCEFRAADISLRLAQRVMYFVNKSKSAEELCQTIKCENELGIAVAEKILEAKERIGRFKDITQIESIKEVGINKFIALVNSVKRKGFS
jgi:hypothetical protein